MQKDREAFEKWASGDANMTSNFSIGAYGIYADDATQYLWEAWQAARDHYTEAKHG